MMPHSLPVNMLEKVADVLELVVMGIVGADSSSPHGGMQAMVNE